MSQWMRLKGVHYLRRKVSSGLPLTIEHKGREYKFATPLIRVAAELKDEGKELICLRIYSTPKSWKKSVLLSEYYYQELDPNTKQENGLTYERNQYWKKVSKIHHW